ncbi:hypothetical protein S1361_37395 [Streptomyces cyanogenus]|uniref:Transposase homolog n=1 Tax=Streptomyces cyanogenus TaxID=80860 RepID=A0ABX7U204_STRCY|nr:hypothetical protein S1361_37395 [Streptomyces cyanogenus]
MPPARRDIHTPATSSACQSRRAATSAPVTALRPCSADSRSLVRDSGWACSCGEGNGRSGGGGARGVLPVCHGVQPLLGDGDDGRVGAAHERGRCSGSPGERLRHRLEPQLGKSAGRGHALPPRFIRGPREPALFRGLSARRSQTPRPPRTGPVPESFSRSPRGGDQLPRAAAGSGHARHRTPGRSPVKHWDRPGPPWAATAQFTGVRATLAQLSKEPPPPITLPSPPCRLSPVAADTRPTEIVDGIRYIVDNGAKWRALAATSHRGRRSTGSSGGGTEQEAAARTRLPSPAWRRLARDVSAATLVAA